MRRNHTGIKASSFVVVESGGGGDVTPDNLFNWDHLFAYVTPSTPNNNVTITGIDVPINFKISYTPTTGMTLQYSLNDGEWTTVSNDGLIAISNLDNLKFRFENATFETFYTIYVYNNSDSDVLLQSFYASLTSPD